MVSGKWAIKAHSVNSEDFKYILGRYEIEERAKEVLREIIEIHKVAIPTAVYEMPEE